MRGEDRTERKCYERKTVEGRRKMTGREEENRQKDGEERERCELVIDERTQWRKMGAEKLRESE